MSEPPRRAGHFSWADYRSLIAKAQRELASLRAGPDEPLDVIFNLVTTVDHIWDWVKEDDELSALWERTRTLRKENPSVAAIHALSVAAKHVRPTRVSPPRTETVATGWGGQWGSMPWGGGPMYVVEVDGVKRPVADVAEDALAAWREALEPR